MRTPGILIFGMVLAPCGWILDLTSTVAPNWRTIHNLANEASDLVVEQGIWDICRTSTTSRSQQCNQQSNDQIYFNSQIIPIAKGMMVASLIVTALGLAVATPGVRCWRERPRWILASLGGLLIFCSGVLTIIPIAWYTHILTSINSTSVKRDPNRSDDIRVGYCIILGYIGGIMEVLGGFVMFLGICSCCGGRNRGEKPPRTNTQRPAAARPDRSDRPTPLPRVSVPRRYSRSTESSVPYSQKSMDDDLDFPRAKTRDRGFVNTSYNGRPYDADL
ncbi:claudin-23-like protein [Labeo rohita]|uniref:Claudin-23-like protein n=2 Tax=Labeo rohita TaxID=84645 RepID=A0A498LB10_LABRO|nr:claudin 23a [Labeo rohita]KAI2660076.1 Claudin-23 [Labeo rohita]RXN05412.1 claudin-23-like protein [Labeo rohita]RXN30581.1 claudin-23-like protein [Labeo rohita]